MSQLTIENNVFFHSLIFITFIILLNLLWLEELILLFGVNVKNDHILRFYDFAYTLVVPLYWGVFCIFEDNCDGKSLYYLVRIYGIFLVYEIFFHIFDNIIKNSGINLSYFIDKFTYTVSHTIFAKWISKYIYTRS